MPDVLVIESLEQFAQFLNEKGIMEIALRGKNKKFAQFQKVVLNNASQSSASEQIKNAINILNKNNQLGEQILKQLGNLAKLNKFSLIMSGLNLCATCVGFAIMSAKLDKMSGEINKVLNAVKDNQSIQTNYEIKKIISEHKNMLDCRKKKSNYTEDQMRQLVADEYNALNMLIETFLKNASNDSETLVFSIYSLASMLAVSIKYFDEIYYFNNKEKIDDGDIWHSEHIDWMKTFDLLLSKQFIKKIQDFGFFELELNTNENDYYYISLCDQILSLKQEVEDNQELLMAIDDKDAFKSFIEFSKADIKNSIEKAFDEANVSFENQEIKNSVEDAFKQVAIV